MPEHVCVENGPQPDQEFLDLISEAVQENDGNRCIPKGQNHLVIDMVPLYKAVIRKFFDNEYPKIKSSSFLQHFIHFRWEGVFLHQEGRIPEPSLPERALIIIPLMVHGDLRAQDNILLESGRPICINGSTSLGLSGPGTLLSIDLGFSR